MASPVVSRADASLRLSTINRITVDGPKYVPRRSITTAFPERLIRTIFDAHGEWTCEIIARFEDPEYVARVVTNQAQAYCGEISGTILDFGCGLGASTIALAKRFPNAYVIGVELREESVRLGRSIAAELGIRNATFLQSPTPDSLPNIGSVDVVMLSAVWEHLLPAERKTIAPLLWGTLKTGGSLLINQTPWRWLPNEHHSTGLWGINYAPDRVAHWMARNWTKFPTNTSRSEHWEDHLRGGIRGGTEREVISAIRAAGGNPRIAQPVDSTRAKYWLDQTSPRLRSLKRVIASFYAATDAVFGVVPSTNMDVCLRKA